MRLSVKDVFLLRETLQTSFVCEPLQLSASRPHQSLPSACPAVSRPVLPFQTGHCNASIDNDPKSQLNLLGQDLLKDTFRFSCAGMGVIAALGPDTDGSSLTVGQRVTCLTWGAETGQGTWKQYSVVKANTLVSSLLTILCCQIVVL